MAEHSEDIKRLRAIIDLHKERKYILQERQAKLDLSADPSLELEIQDIEKRILKLDEQITALQDTSSGNAFALNVKTKVYNKRVSLFPKIVSDLNLMIIAIENIKWLVEFDQPSKDTLEESDFIKMREILLQVETATERFINKYRSDSIFVPIDIDEIITSFVVKFSEFSIRIRLEKQPLKFIIIETHDHCKQMFGNVIGLMRKYVEEGK